MKRGRGMGNYKENLKHAPYPIIITIDKIMGIYSNLLQNTLLDALELLNTDRHSNSSLFVSVLKKQR